MPHVRMMDTGYQNASLANLFGLPYVVIRQPQPIDTATLNDTGRSGIQTRFLFNTSATVQIDLAGSAYGSGIRAPFPDPHGNFALYHSGYIASVLREDDLTNVKNDLPGLYRRHVEPGQEVHRGRCWLPSLRVR